MVARSEEELLPHLEAWDDLARNALESNVFYESWMLLPAVRAFGAGADVVICFSDFASRDAEGRIERRHLMEWQRDRRGWDQTLGSGSPFSSLAALPPGHGDFPIHICNMYLPMMRSDHIAIFTALVRRVQAGALLTFAEDLAFYEDCDYFARLAKVGAGAFLDCETTWQHGHTGPRFAETDPYAKISSRLTFLQRVYGSDPEFLAQHGEEYAERLAEEYRKRAH